MSEQVAEWTDEAGWARSEAIRQARQAALERESAQREEAEREARVAAREAAEVVRRTSGMPLPTAEEQRASLEALQAEDDQYLAAQATIAKIDRRRASRRRTQEQAAREEAVAAAAGRRAVEASGQLRTYPLRVPGLPGATAYADGLLAELQTGPVSEMALFLRSELPRGQRTRERVVGLLREAGIDPATGYIESNPLRGGR